MRITPATTVPRPQVNAGLRRLSERHLRRRFGANLLRAFVLLHY